MSNDLFVYSIYEDGAEVVLEDSDEKIMVSTDPAELRETAQAVADASETPVQVWRYVRHGCAERLLPQCQPRPVNATATRWLSYFDEFVAIGEEIDRRKRELAQMFAEIMPAAEACATAWDSFTDRTVKIYDGMFPIES